MSKPMQIDVEAILASKAGKKARFVPRFLISYLKKIIHQDEVNGFLRLHGDKMDYEFVDAFMKFFKNSFEVCGFCKQNNIAIFKGRLHACAFYL